MNTNIKIIVGKWLFTKLEFLQNSRIFMWPYGGHVGVQNISEKAFDSIIMTQFERYFAIVLYTNIAFSSREWKPRISMGWFAHFPQTNLLVFDCKYLASLIVEASSLEVAWTTNWSQVIVGMVFFAKKSRMLMRQMYTMMSSENHLEDWVVQFGRWTSSHSLRHSPIAFLPKCLFFVVFFFSSPI